MKKNGLLLINLGTPDQPTPKAVGRFLKEFLSDEHVLSLPKLLRYPLLYLFILPFRKYRSAKAYQAIWQSEGSPLLLYSQQFQIKLAEKLGSSWKVALGMSYGNPSMASALEALSDCDHLIILPLYPQYSYAATTAALHQCFQLLQFQAVIPHLSVISDFYRWPGFIEAQAKLVRPYLSTHDFVLFSYHGIPVRHLSYTGCPTPCALPSAPYQQPSIPPSCLLSPKPRCYRAQCYSTSHSLAQTLKIPTEQYGTGFQSRLGRTPWIEPYTDALLSVLVQKGIKRLLIVAPSFVADCLETLEEIGLRMTQQWQALGGAVLTLVPCLNAQDTWVEELASIIQKMPHYSGQQEELPLSAC